MTGKLGKAEKEKCQWYLENGIFNAIWIASKIKVKNRVQVKYEDFEAKYGNLKDMKGGDKWKK